MSDQKCIVASFEVPSPSARIGAARLESDLDSLFPNGELDRVSPAAELTIDAPAATVGSVRLTAVLTAPTI